MEAKDFETLATCLRIIIDLDILFLEVANTSIFALTAKVKWASLQKPLQQLHAMLKNAEQIHLPISCFQQLGPLNATIRPAIHKFCATS